MDQQEPICKSLGLQVCRAETALQGGIKDHHSLSPTHLPSLSFLICKMRAVTDPPQRVCVSLKMHVCKPRRAVPHTEPMSCS